MESVDESPELNPEERQIVDQFHALWYTKMCYARPKFKGIRCIKNPFDLWIYQELIYQIRPDLIIETGSYEGGSAVFFHHMQQCFMGAGKGRVITIDQEPKWTSPIIDNPDIVPIMGDSTSSEVFERVLKYHDKCKACMVIIDSDHSKVHVLNEMERYGPLVTKGSYFIIEDGNINGHPILPDYGPGPFEAIEEFLPNHPEFEPDLNLERKFLFTFAVKGFLKRL